MSAHFFGVAGTRSRGNLQRLQYVPLAILTSRQYHGDILPNYKHTLWTQNGWRLYRIRYKNYRANTRPVSIYWGASIAADRGRHSASITSRSLSRRNGFASTALKPCEISASSIRTLATPNAMAAAAACSYKKCKSQRTFGGGVGARVPGHGYHGGPPPRLAHRPHRRDAAQPRHLNVH